MPVDQVESEQKPVPINPSAKLISQPSNVSHNFSVLWIGQAVSIIGSQFSNLSIQMIAVTILRANPTQMGFLTASQTFPYLILSLFVGVLVDRVSKRSLLLMADSVRAVALIAAAALLMLGHMSVSVLCSIVCFISLFTLVFDAALGAAIPELFEPNQRLAANSRLNMSLAGGDVVGPTMSGFALRLAGTTGTMLLDSISYLFSALCVFWGIPKGMKAGKKTEARRSVGVLRSVAEGIAFVSANRVLRILGTGSAIWNFSWSAVLAVLVIHGVRDLKLTMVQIGFVFASGGIGGIAGSLLGWRLVKEFRQGPVLVLTPLIGIAGGIVLLLPSKSYPFFVSALALFLYNLGESSFGVNMQTVRQAVTPLHLMGRMDTAMRFCFKGMASLGAVVGGMVASQFGLRTTLLLGVMGLVVTFTVFVSSNLYRFHFNSDEGLH
jgi:MFS family permease